MEQLLSIKHIPIEIEVNVQRAELKAVQNSGSNLPSATVNYRKSDGTACLQTEPVMVDLDQRKFDSNNNKTSVYEGISLTYHGVAKMGAVSDGENSTAANSHIKLKKASRSLESILSSLPKARNSSGISFDNGKLSLNYTMNDKDLLDLEKHEFEFIPGKIEFIINQMPSLEIEYLGEPLYFPRSADPNYEPAIDLKA